MMDNYSDLIRDASGNIIHKRSDRIGKTPLPLDRRNIFTLTAITEGGWGTLWPDGGHLYGDYVTTIVPPGALGTKK